MSLGSEGAVSPDVNRIVGGIPGFSAFVAFLCSGNLPELVNMGMGTGVILAGIAVNRFILLLPCFRIGAAGMCTGRSREADAYNAQTKKDQKKYAGYSSHGSALLIFNCQCKAEQQTTLSKDGMRLCETMIRLG